MPAIPGSVPVTGFFAPTDDTDVYPVTEPLWGIDGHRSVVDAAERDAIPDERRREGMLAYTADDGKTWQLNPAPWVGNVTDWSEFTTPFTTPFGTPEVDTTFVQTHRVAVLIAGVSYYIQLEKVDFLLLEDATNVLLEDNTNIELE